MSSSAFASCQPCQNPKTIPLSSVQHIYLSEGKNGLAKNIEIKIICDTEELDYLASLSYLNAPVKFIWIMDSDKDRGIRRELACSKFSIDSEIPTTDLHNCTIFASYGKYNIYTGDSWRTLLASSKRMGK